MRDPDPMQDFYARDFPKPLPWLSEDRPADPDRIEIPPVPRFRIKWSGFLVLGAAFLLVVFVARMWGKTAAEISVVSLFVVGVIASIRARHRFPWGAGHGDGMFFSGPGCGDGGGGGGGGGDC